MKRKKLSLRRPTRHQARQFFYFNLGGLSFFVLGYFIFVICYGSLHMPWWLSKLIADFVGAISNFFIQRYVAFRLESKHIDSRRLLGRFGIISFTNVIIDYAIVASLNAVGVSPFIGLIVSAGFFTAWKYIWYKKWVFRPKRVSI
jgi:putative flippase GtrA